MAGVGVDIRRVDRLYKVGVECVPLPAAAFNPLVITDYPTRDDALAARPNLPPPYIRTAGFHDVNDGGDGLYGALLSPPSDVNSPGLIMLTLFAGFIHWYALSTANVNSSQFGSRVDAADNIIALQSMLDWVTLRGGTAKFVGRGDLNIKSHMYLQGPYSRHFGVESDIDCWIRKGELNLHFNLFDIYDCENISLGNLNFNLRQKEMPAIYVADDGEGGRIWTTDNLGYGLTIRNCSNISHVGKLRVHDCHEGVLVYTSPTTEPPVYHDVVLDYVEVHAYVETDDIGHVLDGGWAVAGMLIVNMKHSGVNFVDVVGVLTNQPGFAIEYKLDCHDCWFNGYSVRQSHVAVSALGTGAVGGPMDASNCWFGPGLIDQCKVALALSHAEKTTFAHIRARHHPDLWPAHDLGTPPWFVQITGNASDCTVMIEIIDYDGGVNDEPPVYLGGDRNTVIVPMINNHVPKYATIAAGSQHCSIAIWQDVSLNTPAVLSDKFIDLALDDTNNFYVGGGGFGWRQGPEGGVKIDVNELSVRAYDDGNPAITGQGYLQLSAEHFNPQGIQREVPPNGYSFNVNGHVQQVILEPVAPIASCNIHFPAGTRGKTISFTSTQNIAACSFTPSGGDVVVGAPASLTAHTPVTFRFLDDTGKWYRA